MSAGDAPSPAGPKASPGKTDGEPDREPRGPHYARRAGLVLITLAVLAAFFFNASADAGTEVDADRWLTATLLGFGGIWLQVFGARKLWIVGPSLALVAAVALGSPTWIAVCCLLAIGYALVGFRLPDSEVHSDDDREMHGADHLRENVEAVAMALIIALVVKEFAAEAFVIPTGSMEPTIYGTQNGRRQGDRLLAAKWPLLFGDPPRWSIVVFRFPLYRKTNYIKRLVGLPGEHVKIVDGDIYVNGVVETKPDAVQNTLWFDHFPSQYATTLAEEFSADSQAEWDIDDERASVRALPGTVTRMRLEQRTQEKDLRIGADLELSDLQDDAAVFLTVEGGGRRVELEFAKDGAWITAPGTERQAVDLPSLSDLGTDFRIGLGVADRVAHVYLDGRRIAKIPHLDESNHVKGNGNVTLGFRGLAAFARNVRVHHDQHYSRKGQSEWDIPADSYIMLGDNTNASQDSRLWTANVVTLPDGTEYVVPTSRRTPDERTVANFKEDADFLVFHDADGVPRRIPKSAKPKVEHSVSRPFVKRRDLLGRAFFTFFPFPPMGEFRPRFHP